jgi:1-deoxy-D-xylulose-5-phosphate synthase
MNENHYSARIKILGIPDRFIEHGTQAQLYEEVGLSASKIAEAIKEMATENV